MFETYFRDGISGMRREFETHKFSQKTKDYALYAASENGFLDVVQFLIEKGANIRRFTDHCIQLPSLKGHLDVVKFLVEKCGADVHTQHNFALRSAVMNNHLNVATFLIGKGAFLTENDLLFIHNTSHIINLEMIKLLCENGSTFYMKNTGILSTALNEKKFDIVKYLVDKNADNREYVNYTLINACRSNCLEIVKFLYEKNLNLESQYALKISCGNNHLEIVKFLVEEIGVDIHYHDDEPLRWTCGIDVIRYLTESGCIPDDDVLKTLIKYNRVEEATYIKEFSSREDIERCFENISRWKDGCEHPDKQIVLRCCLKTVCEDCYLGGWTCLFCEKYILGKIKII